MDQLWALAQAQEAARLAVNQLSESASRSKIHKQQCYQVAQAGEEVFARLELAVRERTVDVLTLCSAAARLSVVVNDSRLCVEQLGNPSPLGRITATIFPYPRKNADRILSKQCKTLLEIAEDYAGLWSTPQPLHGVISNGRLESMSNGRVAISNTAPWFRAKTLSRRPPGSLGNPVSSLHRVLSSPVTNVAWAPYDSAGSLPADLVSTPRARRDVSRGGLLTPGALGLSPQASSLRMGVGPGVEALPVSPSADSEEADPLRSQPFSQRSVRPSDGNPVQRLCFMRGAGGESAAVQLMVVLNRQIEVYSAALDSFHSDTPLDVEAQQVTATALYEPTIDLITGHRGGTVLVYGRVGAVLSASASNLRGGVLGAAAAAATAAQQAGVPLVVRLSRAAVTALHCVPAIELEAASATMAAQASTPPPQGSAAAAAEVSQGSGAATAAAGESHHRGSHGGTPPGQAASGAASLETTASGSIGSCTADDVLLFTGDAQGRVMAVRYSRVQPEVLATTVFTSSRRSARSNSNTAPVENPTTPEITGLLYRSGCLLVSTATDMYSIRVVSVPQQATGVGTAAGGADGNASGIIEAEGGGATAGGAEHTAANGTNSTTGLPQSSSVNLLSPACSAMPSRNGTAAAGSNGGGGGGGGGAAGAAVNGGTGAAAAGAGTEPIIRKGTLHLSTTLVDTFPFADFDSCTALVAIEWPVPESSLTAGSTADSSPVDGAGALSLPRPNGGLLGFGAAMTETTSLACWAPGVRGTPNGVVAAAAAAAAANGRGPGSGGGGTAGAGVVGAAAASTASVAAGRTPKFVAARQGPWRMLSAHMNGQLLMWDVTAGRLQLICAIGQPGPPIVNVFTFPDLGTMVELLSTGHIRVGPLPTSSLAPPINPLGNVPVWQFSRASMRAHRGRLTAGAALANCIATGSRAGGVKVWSAFDLRARAASQDVAFLSPWPATAAAAAAAAAAGIRSAGSGSPTASDPYSQPRSRASRAGGAGIDEPPFHVHGSGMNGGAGGGGGPLVGGPSQVTSGPGSLVSTTAVVHPPYPSNGGPYAAFSRMPSGHTSLASHMGVPPSAYPFLPQMQVPGPEPFNSPYPAMSQGVVGNGIGGLSGLGGAPVQHLPGVSGGGAEMAVPMASPPATHLQHPHPHPQHHPQQQAVAAQGAGAVAAAAASAAVVVAISSPAAGRSVSALSPFVGTAADGHDAAAPRGGTGSGSAAPAEPLRASLPNGIANGGHIHGPRSEDSVGHLSAASSLAGGNVHAPTRQQPQRSTQGLRPAAAVTATQSQPQNQQPQQQQGQQQQPLNHNHVNHHQQPVGLARVSERPTGDTTPSRPANRAPMLTQTERAIMNVFTQGSGEETLNTSKLPTVAPVGADAEGFDAINTADITTATSTGGAAGGKHDAGASVADAPAQVVLPPYPLPAHQHYPAPPSPGISRSPTPGPSLLPQAVMAAAADIYGAVTPMYGNFTAPYPNMPTISTDAFPAPPQQHCNLAMPQPQRLHSVPYGLGVPDPRMSPPPGAYHSPQLHAQMYCGGGLPSPLGNGAGVPIFKRTSEYGVAPAHPQMYPPAGGQRVPGPQLGAAGRRPSIPSELELMSGRVSPFEAPDSGEVGLPPPPPFLKPPPVVTPAMPQGQDTQLSQNVFIRPEDLRNVEKIGEGAEGIVSRARWHHIDVAVKEMHPSSASFGHLASIATDLSSHDPSSASGELAGLIKEVAALIDLGQHPNIIRFIGICTMPPRIVTEYYKMGSLYSMLKEARQGNMRTREKLAWDRRLIMLKDIAAGMAYLHSRDYIHGDLRSPNVFVTEDQHLKIGDFGFARILGKAQNHVVPARLTNPRWQAPEVYDMADPIATTAADVYSFGIIMYEMLTFRLPYDEETEDEVVKLRHTFNPDWRPELPPDRQLPVSKSVHREGHLPPLQAYKTLMMDCWAVDPQDRPGFHKIATRLNALCHWQWALSVIKRSLRFGQRSRPRGGGGVDASAEVTPTCMTPTSVSSPTASSRSAVTALPPQLLNHMLDEVALSLEQQQRDPAALERQRMEARLGHEEGPAAGMSSPASATATPAAAAAAAAATPALPLLPPLPPLPQQQPQQQPPVDGVAAVGGMTSSPARKMLGGQLAWSAGGFATRAPGPAADVGRASPWGSAPAPAAAPAAPQRPRMLSALHEPVLEPAPTLATTVGVPSVLQASPAAPLLPPPQQSRAAPSPLQPPLRGFGAAGDGHVMPSPFEIQLSDDDDEDGDVVPAKAALVPVGRLAAIPEVVPVAAPGAAAAVAVAPSMTAARADAAASPPPLGTVTSVTALGPALIPPRMGSAPVPPPASAPAPLATLQTVASVALPVPPMMPKAPAAPLPHAAQAPGALLARKPSFQPPPPQDPLEMRTAFHLGIGFSIDDDD